MKYKLQDLIDIKQFQLLQDRLNEIYSFPSAIIDNEGNVLTATAWQDICTKFHRVNKESETECIKSDQYILDHIQEANPAVSYLCPHGLIDNATPIVIEGVHYGNFFTGQFFLEPPDLAFFKAQAKKYGFDETAYLEAVRKVPVWTREQLNNYLFFIKGLIAVISGIGLKNLREIEVRQQIKESEEEARTVLAQMFDGFWVLNEQDRIVDANEALCRMTKYTRDELLKMSAPEVETEESPAARAQRTQRIIREGSLYYESKFRCKDGTILDIEVSARHLPQPRSLIGFHRDITERKQAEEKLRWSEKFIRSILDTVDEGFIVVDRDYRILTANKAFCRQVCGGDEELIGTHCYSVSHRILHPCFEEGEECPVKRVFETGEPAAAFHKHQDKDGHVLFVETKAYPIKDDSGNVTSAIETINNITEKHLLAEEQLKTQKLESIGTLAGGIAHDFNNLLQGVFGYISMAKRTLEQKQTSLQMLEQAEAALHLSVNLTTQLLTFSKGGSPVRNRIALRPIIENSAKFALSGSRVDCRISSDTPLWTIKGDEGQISQVIQNIVLNAEQAMPMGGAISITVKNVSIPDGESVPALRQGNYVKIAIQDSGIGIPEPFLSKIFDPYFTTKDKGSGLGLATTYSIIRNHGGTITVQSELGRGSTFFVYLPAVADEEAQAQDVALAGKAIRKGKILLMDDEAMIRDVAGAMLAALGHEVVFAKNGAEAVEEYRQAMGSGRRFDIVILDLTIRGGMGGEEAIRELLELDPDIKAIVSSGYSNDAAIAEYKRIGFRACLKKPYNTDLLNATLNSLLA